jgi:hypothetical protein
MMKVQRRCGAVEVEIAAELIVQFVGANPLARF